MAERRIDPRLEVTETRQGRRPGDTYIRRVRPYDELFQRSDEGELIATERTVLDRPGWTRALRKVRTILIGRPISTQREEHERLTKLKALAIFSSDNISSSAYATEEMMRILIVAGIGAISLTMPLTIMIAWSSRSSPLATGRRFGPIQTARAATWCRATTSAPAPGWWPGRPS